MQKSGFISIIGRPNAGKSTLLNHLLGMQLSIVTPKAQTTRERVLGILTEADSQIVFVDTPGIHRAREGGLNQYMVNEAKEALEAPHLIWYLVDPNSAVDYELTVLELLEKSSAPVFLIMNKADTLRNEILKKNAKKLESDLLAEMQKRNIQAQGAFSISALQKAGTQDLLTQSWKWIPEGPWYYADPEQVSDRPTRFFVAEKIRERLFYLLGEEIPYSCAVEIESFQENAQPLRIEAVIHVERESQKGIVIGKGGQKIKEIGQSARIEIEKFLGQKIFLGLKVKVSKDWSANPDDLRRMGLSLPRQGKK